MRDTILAATLATALFATNLYVGVTFAQTPPPAASAEHYSTSTTDIGTLLDDKVAHAIVDKFLPGVLSGDQIDMARSMTLKDIQQFGPDRITDKALAAIDAEFAKLPAKK
jgi:hypothetical protein